MSQLVNGYVVGLYDREKHLVDWTFGNNLFSEIELYYASDENEFYHFATTVYDMLRMVEERGVGLTAIYREFVAELPKEL